MGKNNGKGARTPYAKWTSIMRKVDNELAKEKQRVKVSNTDKENK